MSYRVAFTKHAGKDLAALEKAVAARIAAKIDWLAKNMDTVTPLPLRENLSGLYKLRVGDWRALYTVDNDAMIITFYKIRHRNMVYKP